MRSGILGSGGVSGGIVRFVPRLRRLDAVTLELTGLGSGRDRRAAMLLRSQQRAVGARGMLVVRLLAGCGNVLLVLGRPFRSGGLRSCPACTAVVADAVYRRIVHHHGLVDVGVVDHCGVDAHHRRVVLEDSAVPAAYDKTDAAVPEPAIHAAAKPDLRTSVAGRPEQSRPGGKHPCPRNPVIPFRPIRTITRRP